MSKEIMLISEITPNPNAIRIVSNMDFRVGQAASFTKKDSNSNNIEMIKELFNVDGIEELYLFDNFLTVIKNSDQKWENIVDTIKQTITNLLPFHNPEFEMPKAEKKEFSPKVKKEIEKIEKILDKSVRPALQSDGGDLEIISLDGNILEIAYKGACDSCPSAASGTLKGIEEVLKNEYDKKIQVKADISSPSFDIFY